ncbi:MAG: hypothetical protein ACOC2L_01910, partial [Candidatus Sumerlaeota bacterium]
MKNIRQIIALTTLLLLYAIAATAQDGERLELRQLGQSYRTPMSIVKVFANSRGHAFNSRERLPAGVPVRAHWQSKNKEFAASSHSFVAEGPYDVLCLVPYYDFQESSLVGSAGFFGLALEQNADVRAYLVDHWPRRAMSDEEKQAWLEENLVHFEKMVAAANEAHPDAKHPMRLIPRANAFMELLRRGDDIPGFSSPSCAYNDSGHAGTNANYMFAVMEYCWIYNELPWGLPITYSKENKYFGKMETQIVFDETEEQALALQRIGYYNLAQHPMSGFEMPEDNAAPSAVKDVQVKVTPKSVSLDWPEVQDEGVGVYRYVVQRSDGKEFDHVLSFFTDTTVDSDKKYTYTIVAEDLAGNRSADSELVQVEVPADHDAPKIVKAVADENPGTIRLISDEEIAKESANDPSRYSVEGLEIAATRLSAPDTVVLTTSDMEEGKRYELKAENIRDTADPANILDTAMVPFTFTPPVWEAINTTGWAEAEMDKSGPQIRLKAKGEGPILKIGHLDEAPPLAGFYKTVKGNFDFPLAVTSQGQVAANAALKPYQRNRGFVKSGIIIAADINDLKAGNHAAFYLSDVPRFHFSVSRNWLVTGRVIGAGLRWGDPKEYREGFNLPVWMRLVREGNDLTAYY